MIGGTPLGNYLGTIALCGFVAEMVAILLFEMAEPTLNEHALDDSKQHNLFGAPFEKLGQARRVRVLVAYGIIDAQVAGSFDSVRAIRRRYLHLMSAAHDDLPADAVAVLKHTVSLVVSAMGLGIAEGGRLAVSASFLRYLKKGRQ